MTTQRPCLCRASAGMTLLEVLVACGILVVGLASIAAMLPAAGSRLGQAAREDRAGNLAANALAQARSAGVIAADVFSNPDLSVAFGSGLRAIPGLPRPPERQNLPPDWTRFAGPAGPLALRIDPTRGFLLEDEVTFGAPATAETPVNDFADGRRSFKEAVCWGATIVPNGFPVSAGTTATLSIAVARSTPTAKAIALQGQSGGLYRMETPNDSDMKTFLRGCSYVIVLPSDTSRGPRWFRILASWKAANVIYVVFDNADMQTFAGNSPTVIGFDTLIRVDEHQVLLQ